MNEPRKYQIEGPSFIRKESSPLRAVGLSGVNPERLAQTIANLTPTQPITEPMEGEL